MKLLNIIVICAAAVCLNPSADAQNNYPTKPIKIINPYAPGGSSDQLARVIAEKLSGSLHQPVIVENRTGASGMIGATACKQAAADGYTICILFSDILAINPYIYKNISYASKDFVSIVGLATVDTLVVTRPSLGVTSIKGLESAAKNSASPLSFSTAGVGSSPHLIGERIAKSFKVDFNEVPYQGTAPAVIALLGGQVDATMTTYSVASQHIASGKLVPIAVLGDRRLPSLPSIATLTEQGIVFDGRVWQGFFAPAGTPKKVVNQLNEAVNKILKDPEFVQLQLRANGFTAMGGSPEDLDRRVTIDGEIWGNLAKSLNLKLD